MTEEIEADLVRMLVADHARMRSAGTALAEAALRVIREYDGTHRLSLAVADWAKAVADEGGRAERTEKAIARQRQESEQVRLARRDIAEAVERLAPGMPIKAYSVLGWHAYMRSETILAALNAYPDPASPLSMTGGA